MSLRRTASTHWRFVSAPVVFAVLSCDGGQAATEEQDAATDASIPDRREPHLPSCNPLETSSCELRFGCSETFDGAVDALEAECVRERPFEPEWEEATTGVVCGFQAALYSYGLETHVAFYDLETNELVGWWHEDDVGYGACAGVVPANCAFQDSYGSGQQPGGDYLSQTLVCGYGDSDESDAGVDAGTAQPDAAIPGRSASNGDASASDASIR